jgi:hypothetical protein
MQVFEKETFTYWDDRDSAASFCDIEFKKCHFDHCFLSLTFSPQLRSTIRNVRLIKCSQKSSTIYSAIVEDVLIDGLKSSGFALRTNAAVFNRVTMQGKIDRLMLTSTAFIMEPQLQPVFDQANAEYYKNVEWALDISNAEFNDITIRGLPGHLIRRDPETQLLVTRKNAIARGWEKLKLQNLLFPIVLDEFLDAGNDATVLVAPKRDPKFKSLLADLMVLKKAGIAESD